MLTTYCRGHHGSVVTTPACDAGDLSSIPRVPWDVEDCSIPSYLWICDETLLDPDQAQIPRIHPPKAVCTMQSEVAKVDIDTFFRHKITIIPLHLQSVKGHNWALW